jgi:SAM-dependent methyltransferase
MRGTEKVGNVLRGLLQRYGTENIKRRLWNHEYRRGRWNCLDSMADDCVYTHIEKHAKNGSILDLGCGPGAVGTELSGAAYHSYTGVDICDVAIEKARSRAAENRRTEKNAYFQSDILSYVPKQYYDVIFFGDSIYYFSWQRIIEILNYYSKYLKQDGVFIVRTWTMKDKHQTIVHNIENDFDVVEKHPYAESQIVVIVFRPPATRREGANTGDHS